jgi:hypothetical protein
VGSLAFATLAWAQAPVAVVEDVSGKVAGVEFMDYVAAGKVIKLGARDTIVLGYLKSCWRETIAAGTVTIGTEQSEVQNGKVERTRVKCDGGRINLSAEQAVQSAGVISRSISGSAADAEPARMPQPQVRLYGRIPIVEVGGTGNLVIERLDEPGEHYDIAVGKRELVRGAFVDLAKSRRILAPGGLYRATFGARQVVFAVDSNASAAAPLLARLLRL